MRPHETRFDGIRVRYDAAKSYDELLAALLADIGRAPALLISGVVTCGDESR